ncbi:Protein kinase, partial [Phytophthora palmivora]
MTHSTLLLLALLCCSQAVAESNVKPQYENVASEADRRSFRWLDEGVTTTGQVHEWGQQQSFCFHENASLHIRMDPLNSTLQPALIQTLGQSREANALYNMTNATLWYLQRVAWPLQPVFWAWSELRVVVQSPKVNQMTFTFARTPGLLCRSVLKAAHLTPALKEMVPPLVVDAVENFLYVAYLSWVYAQNFFLGLLLFYLSEWLSRSRAFHYVLGATMGVFFSALLALYLFQRQARNTTQMLPGAQLISSLASVATVAVPVTGFVIMPNLYRLGSWAISYLVYLWNREALFGIPHLGKIYFAFFAFFGCVLVWWYQWGASAKSETEPQDEEEIEEL